jgi:hypothetical protein
MFNDDFTLPCSSKISAWQRDERTSLALNPILRGAAGQDIDDINIRLFKHNPDLRPGWVKAYR